MAVNPHGAYPTKTTAPTTGYPYGGAQNVTTPGDGTGTPWIANLINDIFGFQQALLTNAAIIPSGSPDTATASQYLQALQAIFALKTDITTTHAGVRQTVQIGSVDANGYANYLTTSVTLNLPIAATTVPLKIHAAGGAVSNDRLGTVSADTTLLLTASVTSYIYASVSNTGVVTFGSTTLAPIYQFGGTISVTNGQYTFDISRMTMFLGNGTTAAQVYVTFIGEAVTSGTAVTSVVNYALNGVYDSGYTATIPASSTITSKNHNIGTYPWIYKLETLVTTANNGYAVGETASLIYVDGTALGSVITPSVTYKVIQWMTGSGTSNGVRIISKATFSTVAITAAHFSTKLIAQRGW